MVRVITSNTIKNASEALLWLADCTLATVAKMQMKRNPTKYELSRQISMAQTAIKWIRAENLEIPEFTRVRDVIDDYGGIVQDWADAVRAEFFK